MGRSPFQSHLHAKMLIDITEGEVLSLDLPFGKVNNFFRLAGKNQPFIKTNLKEVANAMVNY